MIKQSSEENAHLRATDADERFADPHDSQSFLFGSISALVLRFYRFETEKQLDVLPLILPPNLKSKKYTQNVKIYTDITEGQTDFTVTKSNVYRVV